MKAYSVLNSQEPETQSALSSIRSWAKLHCQSNQWFTRELLRRWFGFCMQCKINICRYHCPVSQIKSHGQTTHCLFASTIQATNPIQDWMKNYGRLYIHIGMFFFSSNFWVFCVEFGNWSEKRVVSDWGSQICWEGWKTPWQLRIEHKNPMT